MKYIGIGLMLCIVALQLYAQPATLESEQFYYSAKGLSYVPVMKKPGLIYEGQLYNDKKRLDWLMAKLNQPEYQLLYQQYRSGRTWASVLMVLGTAASVAGLIGTNSDNRTVNWWLLGAGIGISGAYGVVSNQSAQRLKDIAVLMDQQHKTLGMMRPASSIGINLRIK